MNLLPDELGYHGQGAVEDLIIRAIKKRSSKELQGLIGALNQQVPAGTLIEPGSRAAQVMQARNTLYELGSPLGALMQQQVSPELRPMINQAAGRVGAYQQAPQLSPEIRRLMAQRGFLTPNGITPEGMRFIESLQTGGYGL